RMLVKEYRICMPLTVEENHLKIGNWASILKFARPQTKSFSGAHVHTHSAEGDYWEGAGQYTEKHGYLNSKLPKWIRGFVPNLFYVTEKAWNYYPYTITDISTSYHFCNVLISLPFALVQVFGENPVASENICHLDIAFDEIPPRYYKEEEDLQKFQSKKTGRGPLAERWRQTTQPIMCSYKQVTVKFEVYGLQTKVEAFVHKNIRDILLVGHRQAVAWIDEWYGMTMEDVRKFEKELQEKTNSRVKANSSQQQSEGKGEGGLL
uniref:Phosphatidylinositol transfer protein cytoplasmic 1b n=1 Tax=Latimeria chalumnae TaxID=7897 RepID=H3A4W7_LATCH